MDIATAAFTAPPAGSIEAADAIPRRVPVPVLRPALRLCKPSGVRLDAATRVVLAADRGGVGEVLAGRLRQRGMQVLGLEPSADREAVGVQLDAWLRDGGVHGVYWLPALDDEGPLTAMDAQAWREAVRTRAKNLAETLRRVYDHGPFLVVATRLGGRHGYDPAGALCPLGGAVTGCAKAYKGERPDALVKAVDFAAGGEAAALADRLIGETLVDPGCVEVGGDDALRWAVGLQDQPAADGSPGLRLSGKSVYLITGAAGSIVSAIIADLAVHGGGGIFHLLDLTPAPDPDDDDLRAFGTNRAGLRAELIARARAAGQKATPVSIEQELARIERRAMAAAAISAVRAAGGQAHYHRVDLTDAAGVSAVVAGIAAAHGRIDVLIHAAGLQISRRLPDKPPSEHDFVFDVKSDGWFHLMHAIGDLPVAATVAFSSVAGRFGHLGQTDYTGANDLLCKLTSNLRRTRPGTRGIAVDWTAWAGIGMATRGSIPTQMAAMGIDMLAPEAGIATVRRELTAGGTRGEVVIGGVLGIMTSEFDDTGGLDLAQVDLGQVDLGQVDLGGGPPRLGRVTAMGLWSGLTVTTTLDPATLPSLNAHRIEAGPVPADVVDLFADVAALPVPARRVGAVSDLLVHEPISPHGHEPRRLVIRATFVPVDDALVARCELVSSRHPAGRPDPADTVHVTARVRLDTKD